jgi:peroxiredoxin
MKSLLRISLALALISGIILLTACAGGNGQVLTINSPAPDFQLKDLDGQSVSLGSFLGKTVLINFWATTCPPCVGEMPHLQDLYNSWVKRNDVVLLTINGGETFETVKKFIQTNQYTFPVLLDSRYEVAAKYNVKYIPNSFFIDKKGNIKISVIGPFKNKAAIEAELASFEN